jgi:hypothetical protein
MILPVEHSCKLCVPTVTYGLVHGVVDVEPFNTLDLDVDTG